MSSYVVICSDSTPNGIVEMAGNGAYTTLTHEGINHWLMNHGLSPLTSAEARVHDKVRVGKKFYFAKNNKRVKKRNSYSVEYYASLHPQVFIDFHRPVNNIE